MKTKNWNLLALGILVVAAIIAVATGDPTLASSVAMGGMLIGNVDLSASEKEYKQVQTDLGKVRDDLKAFAEKATSEVKAAGDMSAKTKEKVDEMLTTSGELQARLLEVEQKMVREPGGDEDRPKTVGEMVAKTIETDAEVKALLAKPRQGKSINIDITRQSIRNTMVMAALTDTSGGGTSLTFPPHILPLLAPLVRRLTVRDLLMPGRTNSSAIFYPRETGFTNNADYQSEQGALKEKSVIEFEDVTAPVVTIAHLLDISLQMLADVPYLQSYINGRLMYGLKLKEEDELLNGSGVGNNIEGIYTAATAYSQPAGAVVTDEQEIDRLRLMLLQVELADAMATGIVMHPVNWANIELLKDGEKRYLFTNPTSTTTGRLWSRDVVATKAMSLDKALVGDFAAHAQILDREDANLAISFENKDNFERNLATLRLEERLVLAIYRPEAFVAGDIGITSV